MMARVVVVVVLLCCGLLPVTALPLPRCPSLVHHVESLIDAARPPSAADLRRYLACLGIELKRLDNDDDDVRQLLALAQSTAEAAVEAAAGRGGWSTAADDVEAVEAAAGRGGWSTAADDVEAAAAAADACGTVECLARRATLTFEPCAGLPPAQCSTLVHILERIVASASPHDAAHLPDHFRQFAASYRKLRRSHVTAGRPRTRRHAVVADDEAHTETGNDKRAGKMTSSRVARMRRSAAPREVPFQLPEQMTAETQAVIDAYLEWRAKNGYGRFRQRWGR